MTAAAHTGAYTTEDFGILGVSPMMGRDFTAADNRWRREVAIIGYGIWQRDFAGAKDVVGRNVRVNGKPATIIGVMPKGFAFPRIENSGFRVQRIPAQATKRSVVISPAVVADQTNRLARSGERRATRPRGAGGGVSDTNKQFNTDRSNR